METNAQVLEGLERFCVGVNGWRGELVAGPESRGRDLPYLSNIGPNSRSYAIAGYLATFIKFRCRVMSSAASAASLRGELRLMIE